MTLTVCPMFDTEPSQPGGYGRDVGMPSLSIGISSNMTAYDVLTLGTRHGRPHGLPVITDLGRARIGVNSGKGVGSGAELYRRTLGDDPLFFSARIRPYTHTLRTRE